MALVDSDVFGRLNRFWEEMFKSPKEVALGAEYLPNLLGPAIGALRAYHDDEDDDVELRGETERDADVAVRLLRDALACLLTPSRRRRAREQLSKLCPEFARDRSNGGRDSPR